MNNHGCSTGATLNGNPADKIPPNLCYPLEAQASIEHQRLQHQQRQTNYNHFGKFKSVAVFNETLAKGNSVLVLIISDDYYTPEWNTILIRLIESSLRGNYVSRSSMATTHVTWYFWGIYWVMTLRGWIEKSTMIWSTGTAYSNKAFYMIGLLF